MIDVCDIFLNINNVEIRETKSDFLMLRIKILFTLLKELKVFEGNI